MDTRLDCHESEACELAGRKPLESLKRPSKSRPPSEMFAAPDALAANYRNEYPSTTLETAV